MTGARTGRAGRGRAAAACAALLLLVLASCLMTGLRSGFADETAQVAEEVGAEEQAEDGATAQDDAGGDVSASDETADDAEDGDTSADGSTDGVDSSDGADTTDGSTGEGDGADDADGADEADETDGADGSADGSATDGSATDDSSGDSSTEEAFSNAKGATFSIDGLTYEVTVVASGTGEDAAGTVTITDGAACTASELVVGMVSQEGEDGAYYYQVTAVGASAFKGNTTLRTITFTEDLTGPPSGLAIQASAFQDCTALTTVNFPQKVEGIGDSAFQGCTALVEVNFPDGAELYVKTTFGSSAVGSNAFKDCTSLVSITIPAITSVTRFGDAYYDFDDYNPDSNQVIGVNSLSYLYVSGFQSYWHSGAAPTCRDGIGSGAFAGCTSLETVIFQAGSALGAYAYFYLVTGVFEDCTALTSLVFECAQAYAVDPNGALHNGTYTDFFEGLDQDVSLYYAVDYYATQEDAESDDAAGTNRIARVEYERGTSVAAIQAGDAEALATSTYDASAYAHEGYADGVVPDPNEVAVEVFGESAAATEWVWKLTDTQSQREGLTDSCKAYLVPANDVSAGRIVTETIVSLQKRCDQNFSRWIVDGEEQDSSFDVYRYYNDSDYDFTTADPSDDDATSAAESLYLSIESGGEESFLALIAIYAADGTAIDVADCDITYQRYDEDVGELLAAESFDEVLAALSEEGGPVLVSVTPHEDSGYTGTLQVWLLVKGNSGSVAERYTDSAAGSWGTNPTWYYATAKSETQSSGTTAYTAAYAVMVGSSDLSSALVACAFAGLVGAAVNVGDSDDESYGFYLGTKYSGTTGALTSTASSDGQSFSAAGLSASAFAVASYEAFASTKASGARSKLGVSASAYPWGTTALLIDVGALEEVAAAAAAFAYAAAAPVFYTEEDGTVSDETLACLADFECVLVLGASDVFDDEALAALQGALGLTTSVLGDFVTETLNAASLSRAMADYLMEVGLATASIVTVSDAADAFDAIGALNRSGHGGGITLVSAGSADSKQTSAYLRSLRDGVRVVRLFGRSGSNALTEGFDLYESLLALWDEQGAYVQPAVAAGDTVELAGMLFSVGAGSGTAEDPFELTYAGTLWGAGSLAAGVYEVDAVYYALAVGVGAASDEDADDDAETSDEAGEADAADEADEADVADVATSTGGTFVGASSALAGSSSSSGSGGSASVLAGSSGSLSRDTDAADDAGADDDADESGASSGALSAADYVDNGWDVTNVGVVTEVAAVSTVVSGVTSSTSASSASFSPSWAIVVAVVASVVGLCGALVHLLRRRNEGFDRAFDVN